MDKLNNRNLYGIKDSINCYLIVKGIQYEQWTDANKDRIEANKVNAEIPRTGLKNNI